MKLGAYRALAPFPGRVTYIATHARLSGCAVALYVREAEVIWGALAGDLGKLMRWVLPGIVLQEGDAVEFHVFCTEGIDLVPGVSVATLVVEKEDGRQQMVPLAWERGEEDPDGGRSGKVVSE